MENAGLYKELATVKDLVMAYRESAEETERERLFAAIQDYQNQAHLQAGLSH
jgi:hypothetical protein